MQTTLLPVDRLFSLYAATDGGVKYPHATYNMGLRPQPDGGYFGIFRNGSRNARHLLGWPFMSEGPYRHQLYQMYLDERFNVKAWGEIEVDRIVHDVRCSQYGLIGCEKVSEVEYYPVRLHRRPSGNLMPQRVHDKCGKNWNILPDGSYDCGALDGAGLARLRGCIPTVIDPMMLRGSAPPFWLHDRLITTYHDTQIDPEGKRNYFHYFAELVPRWPFDVLRLSPPFKLGRGGEAGRIQFLMACFVKPDDPARCVVSYGEADADNCIGTIKTADVLGLLL